MFDTMKTAKQIRAARIAQNMTQMNLADAMEVSYQAVSNWERGNSMPDIAKLGQLCQILDISIEKLLGTENGTTATLQKMIKESPSPVSVFNTDNTSDEPAIPSEEEAPSDSQPLTVEEIQEIAPFLPPDRMEEMIDENFIQTENCQINFSAISSFAPFLDADYLDKLISHADLSCNLNEIASLAPFLKKETLSKLVSRVVNEECAESFALTRISGLAPFLDQQALNELVSHADLSHELSGVISLAPFLSRETLNHVVNRIITENPSESFALTKITGLAPFLDQQTLDELVFHSDLNGNLNGVVSLAPFLSRETLNKLVNLITDGELSESFRLMNITGLAPFLDQQALDKLISHADLNRDLNGATSLAPFLSRETLNKLVNRIVTNDSQESFSLTTKLSGLAPFLDQETLDNLVTRADPDRDRAGLSALAPFLSQQTLQKMIRNYINN